MYEEQMPGFTSIQRVFARDIAQAVFPSQSDIVSLMASFATFAAGYLARPLGGIILSHYGDRYGRRRVFLLSVFVMSGATLGMGLVPEYAQLGVAASALMVILRLVQGFCLGGELPGALTYVVETAPKIAPFVCGVVFACVTMGVADPGMTAGQALRSPQFWVLSLTYFCCCATHSGPIFHTVSYATACGLPVMAAVTIYSVEGLAGLGGRILFGLAGDRFGAKRVLVIGLFAQALGAGAYFFVRQLGEFYAVAAVFGLIYGGIMPLYAVIAREYFPMRIMGTILGASTVFSSLGMALGPAVGGWIYDTTGSYGWLYIASFGIGLGAMAIALLFPPFPSQRAAAQPA